MLVQPLIVLTLSCLVTSTLSVNVVPSSPSPPVGSNASDLVTSLPGIDVSTLPFSLYAGNVAVNATTGATLFYMMATHNKAAAMASPSASNRLLIWLQGGPGCSSLIGAFMENGPLQPDASGGVVQRDLAWNAFANVLYIDSPVGVGFSYASDPSAFVTNDNKTSDALVVFLQNWLERFPQFKSSELWISGESYGGVYVPELAYRLHFQTSIPVTGFVIGNPVMSCPEWHRTSNLIQMELFYWHGLIPLHTMRSFRSQCSDDPSTDACTDLLNSAQDLIGKFDPDDLYTNFFTGNSSLGVGPIPKASIQALVSDYLNRPDVQKALHANPTLWAACCAEPGQSGKQCTLNYTTHWDDMSPYYDAFYANSDVKIMLYSGDVDIATCPFAYTELCLDGLNRSIVEGWRPWYLQNQTAGYLQTFSGVQYATLKGAGHEAPLFSPLAASRLVQAFVDDEEWVAFQK